MALKFDYTSFARRFVARSPMGSYVGIQITFWIVANNLMALIIYLHHLLMAATYGFTVPYNYPAISGLASLLGLVYGAILGPVNYNLESGHLRRRPFGAVILVKLFVSAAVSLLVFITLGLISHYLEGTFRFSSFTSAFRGDNWKLTFGIFIIFYAIMSMLIGFINLMNRTCGPGVLIPLFLGKYQDPIEEERIFMFMDLRSSTSIAEQLGHIKYSAFIRECFWDIDQVAIASHAGIYQYAGDEVILTWPLTKENGTPGFLTFYFACQALFAERAFYYQRVYGVAPQFKAGVHAGLVTAVEVGDQKREIAYHGDTINTASRIQGLCNTYDRDLLVSGTLVERSELTELFQASIVGLIGLKGKQQKVDLYTITEATGIS